MSAQENRQIPNAWDPNKSSLLKEPETGLPFPSFSKGAQRSTALFESKHGL